MDEQNNLCSFCDNVAENKEHVIPRWIQKHYDLKDQKMRLWNGTTLMYSQATVPACLYCNSERFSKLENKIRQDEATLQEYYLWALKIRYGLALRDSTLYLDRKNPQAGYLISENLAEYGSTFIKATFKALDNNSFNFKPNPFGSVFLFNRDDEEDYFDMVDVPPPYWALSITIPSNQILLVLFADRGIVKKCIRNFKGENFQDSLSNHVPTINSKVLTFSILRWQNHLKILSKLRITDNGIFSESLPKRFKIRKQKIQWYYEIAYHCGLSKKIAKDAYKRDQEIQQLKSIKCG